jgi:hypothetical protein
MGGTYSMHGRDKTHSKILFGNARRRVHLGYLGVDGRNITEWILNKWGGKM